MKNVLAKLEAEGVIRKGEYLGAFRTEVPGVHIIMKDSKFGVINKEGEVVIVTRYRCIARQSDRTYKAYGMTAGLLYCHTFDAEFNLVI